MANRKTRSRNLAYLDLFWDGKGLKIVTYAKTGPGQTNLIDTRVKTGEIVLTKQYLYSVLSFIAGIFKSGAHIKRK